MNKEAMRKLLEDCWEAALIAYGEPEPLKEAKANYITTRLAALDDDRELTKMCMDVSEKSLAKDWVDDGQEGKGLRWVKASERLPEKDYSFGENEFGCFPIRWEFEYRKVLGIGYLHESGHIYNSMNCKPLAEEELEWLSEGQPAQGGKPFMEGKDEK